MEDSERDSTQDWALPALARPPLLNELEARIDEAMVTARASEVAVMAVGEAALEAAEQARHAAGIAERAAATALDAQRRLAAAPLGTEEPVARPAGADGPDERLRNFADRADRIARRLRELSPATAGAGPPRSAP
jgi:hypothetical protein